MTYARRARPDPDLFVAAQPFVLFLQSFQQFRRACQLTGFPPANHKHVTVTFILAKACHRASPALHVPLLPNSLNDRMAVVAGLPHGSRFVYAERFFAVKIAGHPECACSTTHAHLLELAEAALALDISQIPKILEKF